MTNDQNISPMTNTVSFLVVLLLKICLEVFGHRAILTSKKYIIDQIHNQSHKLNYLRANLYRFYCLKQFFKTYAHQIHQ